MQLVVDVVATVVLLAMAYEDFCFRAISWYLFVMYAGCTIAYLIFYGQLLQYNTWLPNLMFLSLQLFLVSIYISFKSRRVVKITDHHLGWGDIYMMLIICFAFSPFHFVMYIIGTMLVAVILHILIYRFASKDITIPLAGYQSLGMVVVTWIPYVISINRYNDQYLIKYMLWR